MLPGKLCAGNEDFYKLLAQIITSQLLKQFWKEKETRNYDWVQKYIRAAADFTRTLRHTSAELSRIRLWNGCRPCFKSLKEEELIVSKVTSVSLFNQTKWAYISHNRAMHKVFYKTISNYVIFLDKSIPTFVSCLVHSL